MQIKSNNLNIQIPILTAKNISHRIINTNSKRLTLKFNQQGILIIRKPLYMPIDKTIFFIEKNMDWIEKNNLVAKPIIRKYEDGEEYLYLGKKYYLKIINNSHSGVFLQDDVMFVYINTHESIKKIVNKWRQDEAEKVFSLTLLKCFNKMSNYLTVYPKIEIKKYKARWGTCYPRMNKISINISLIHADLDLIEYVITHELCHFVYLNHSKEFHLFLRKFIDDENIKRKRLKQYKCYYE